MDIAVFRTKRMMLKSIAAVCVGEYAALASSASKGGVTG